MSVLLPRHKGSMNAEGASVASVAPLALYSYSRSQTPP